MTAKRLAAKAKLGYYKQTYAWVMANPKYLKKPVPYIHPSGAIIWVRSHRQSNELSSGN